MAAEGAHWRDLFRDVVTPDLCSGCGACVVACPRRVLDYSGDRPFMADAESGTDTCRFGETGCTVCTKACVRWRPDAAAMETAVVGRPRAEEESFGVAREIVAVRAARDDDRERGQDGGLVSTLLAWALRTGRIDGAAVSGVDADNPLHAVPQVVDSVEALQATARSRYTYSPNTLALREIPPSRRLALVGTPCQVSAVRRGQGEGLKKFRSVVFTVGLMCSESFTEAGFLDEVLQVRYGIDLHNVRKVNIKGRVIVTTPDGDVEIPLAECKPFARESCHRCADFSAELADISAGGLGLDGWTIAVVRTEVGAQWLHDAVADGVLETRDVEEFPSALQLLGRLSRAQRRRPAKLQAVVA